MKWSMFVVACIVVALSAQGADDVHSVNVGAVKTITIPAASGGASFSLLGINFDAFSDGDANLLGVLGGKITASFLPTLADQVWLWDGTQYKQYAIHTKDNQFHPADINWEDTTNNPAIIPGDALWIVTPNGRPAFDLTLTGQAVADATYGVPITNGFNFVAYPYSADINLQDAVTVAEGGSASFLPTLADQIWLWNGTSYEQYALKDSDGKWRGTAEADWTNTPPTDVSISIGEGFWYVRAAAPFTWTETIPYQPALD